MARLRRRRSVPGEASKLELVTGPARCSVEELKVAWEVYSDVGDYLGPGQRPWAWWRFERGEERPGSARQEAIRLAEIGELTDDEIAYFAEKASAAKARIGTPREQISGGGRHRYSVDMAAVDLAEAIS